MVIFLDYKYSLVKLIIYSAAQFDGEEHKTKRSFGQGIPKRSLGTSEENDSEQEHAERPSAATKHTDFEQEQTEAAEAQTILRSLGYFLFKKRVHCTPN